MNNKELLNKMAELDGQFKKLRKVAFKLAKEMDSIAEQYAILQQEAKEKGLINE